LGISLIVGFFLLGIWQYWQRKQFIQLLSGETVLIQIPDGTTISLNLPDVLFLASDDNYVDIHLVSGNKRRTIVVRSSLTNLESQLATPLSPIQRCHRKYLINTNYFDVIEHSSRKMTIGLKNYPDHLPVSRKFIPRLRQLLPIRP